MTEASQQNPVPRGNRKWSDDDLLAAMNDIQSGKAYQDVCHDKHVPIGTLWSRVKGKYGGELRPKMGAPTMLSDEFEEDIALFVKHMEFLRVPVQKDHLREDIVHYCNENKLKYPKMPKDGPGRSWFERFARIWSEFVDFKSKGDIFRISNDPITMKKWVFERDNYTRIQKFTKSFCNRTYIFVAEVENICVSRGNKFEFALVMIYNAEGELFKPLVIHHGQISGYCDVNYGDIVEFVETSDGDVDRSVTYCVWQTVRRVLKLRKMEDIPVVYFAPRLAKAISLYLWDQCNLENVIIQTIPYNIYNYFKTGNMGVFEKVRDLFTKVADKILPTSSAVVTSIQVCDVLKEMFSSLRISSHLRNSCRRLRIVAVRRLVAEDEIVYDVQEEVDADVQEADTQVMQ